MIFTRNTSNPFDGVFTYLRKIDPFANFDEIINIETSSTLFSHGTPDVVFDPFVTGSGYKDNWASLNVENSSLTVSFIDYYLFLTEYSIRSRNDHFANYPLEWIVDGSNDYFHWTNIHYHERNDDINGKNKSASYPTTSQDYFRIFRFTQIGVSDQSGTSPYHFVLNKLEFFGALVNPSNLPHCICLTHNHIHTSLFHMFCTAQYILFSL